MKKYNKELEEIVILIAKGGKDILEDKEIRDFYVEMVENEIKTYKPTIINKLLLKAEHMVRINKNGDKKVVSVIPAQYILDLLKEEFQDNIQKC